MRGRNTGRRLGILGVVAALGLLTAACTGRDGQKLNSSKHSTYPHHFHDKNGNPHPKFGSPPPPPHTHHHGATWK